jgi:hypothetical protein
VIPGSRLSTQVYTLIGREFVRGVENRSFFLKIGADPAARRFVEMGAAGLEK